MAATKVEKIYVQFKNSALTVYEGDRNLSITVTRSKLPSPPVPVGGEIHPATGSTAKKGKDFVYDTGKPVAFLWPSDDTSLEKTINIPIQENDVLSGDRLLILHESKLINCAKGANSELKVTIKDGKNPSTPPSAVTHDIGGTSGKAFTTFLDDIRSKGIAAGDTARFNDAIAPKAVQSGIMVATAPLPIPDPTTDDPYSKLILEDKPLVYCKYGSVTKPIDLSGNNRTLQYSGKVSTSVEEGYTLDSSEGNSLIIVNEAFPVPALCTVELGFKAISGGLFYFGDSPVGSVNFSLDFLLFGTGFASWIAATIGGQWLTMAQGQNVTDNNWHKFTLINGAASFSVIVDQTVVFNREGLISAPFNGYWHIGNSMNGRTLNGSIKDFSISHAEISVDRAIQRQAAMVL